MKEKYTDKNKPEILDKLVVSICLEMGKSMHSNPNYKDFIEDEIDKFNESVYRGEWYCNIGAKRILCEDNNKIAYTPETIRIAEKILDYTNRGTSKTNN